jgi:carbon monoxide dehydrogenase subunit G
MNLQRSADIRAEIKSVWGTLMDVERWHEWTGSIDKVERLDDGELGIAAALVSAIRRTSPWKCGLKRRCEG